MIILEGCEWRIFKVVKVLRLAVGGSFCSAVEVGLALSGSGSKFRKATNLSLAAPALLNNQRILLFLRISSSEK